MPKPGDLDAFLQLYFAVELQGIHCLVGKPDVSTLAILGDFEDVPPLRLG